MGWWGYGIMEGDGPMDIESFFDDRFPTKPTQLEVIEFIDEQIKYGFRPQEVYAPVAFILMSRGWPIESELRKKLVEGIDSENLTTWKDMQGRVKALNEFKAILASYNNRRIDMPDQNGLFDTFAAHMVNIDGRH